jgi:hypothetical protein
MIPAYVASFDERSLIEVRYASCTARRRPDPTTGLIEALVKMKTGLVIIIVAAVPSLGCLVTSTEPRVAEPVVVEGEHPLAVRTDAGQVWVGSHVWSEMRPAWKAPAHGRMEDLVIRPIASGHEITFLQGGLQWRGEVDRDHNPRGPLVVVREYALVDSGPDARSPVRASAPTVRACPAQNRVP